MPPRFAGSIRARSAASSLASFALSAGCGSTGGGVAGIPGAGVAEIANETPQAASANIASLSDVVDRNPQSAEASDHAWRRLCQGRPVRQCDQPTSAARSRSIPNSAAALTDRALAYRQINRNDEALVRLQPGDRSQFANHMPAYLGRANLERNAGPADPGQGRSRHGDSPQSRRARRLSMRAA